MTRLLVGFMLVSGITSSLIGQQPSPGTDHWAPLRPLVGKWRGPKSGMGGDAIQTTEWKFVVGDQFLQGISTANSEADRHQDIGMISYDKARKKFIYRAFFSEGFVNQYVGEISEDGKTIEFVTESIENGPPGLKAKEVMRIDGDTVSQELHLASGDEPFKKCIWVELKKQE